MEQYSFLFSAGTSFTGCKCSSLVSNENGVVQAAAEDSLRGQFVYKAGGNCKSRPHGSETKEISILHFGNPWEENKMIIGLWLVSEDYFKGLSQYNLLESNGCLRSLKLNSPLVFHLKRPFMIKGSFSFSSNSTASWGTVVSLCR